MACRSIDAVCEAVNCPKPAVSPTLNRQEQQPQATLNLKEQFSFHLGVSENCSPNSSPFPDDMDPQLRNQVFMQMNSRR